jgi:hypothetical protein
MVVVPGLLKKYRPLDIVSLVELRQQMNKVSMKKGADPSTLFEQLSAIENQFSLPGTPMDESHMIAGILDPATDEYQAVISSEKRIRGDTMTLMDLEKVMSEHHRQLLRASGRKHNANLGGDSDHEVALSGFGGVCYHCNRSGHKANKSPVKLIRPEAPTTKVKEAEEDGFKESATIVGKLGSARLIVGKDGNNKAQRPMGYRTAKERGTGGEKAASAVGGRKTTEFLLCALTFPEETGVLDDPNLSIADTAATVHMTPYRSGITNVRKGAGADLITMGNGNQEKAAKVADIVGTMCDKYGNEIGTAKLSEITILPTGRFNLFSVTQMMKLGWSLKGDKQWMVPTPKVYAMYLKRVQTEAEMGNAGSDSSASVKLSYTQTHERLGHMLSAHTKATFAGMDQYRSC